MDFSQFTNKEIKEVFNILKSSEKGLSEKEAVERQNIYGINEIKVREISLLDILLRQFKSPFFYLLFVAAIVAFLIGEAVDGLVISVFILINVSLGFLQEARAERAVLLLKKYIPSTVRILRKGLEKTIDKKFLVPGDIVLLEAGNIAPADLRILKTRNFSVDEEILSGESVPVAKIPQALEKEAKEIFESKNIVFAGTSVISGEAECIVVATGKKTFFGEIAKLTAGISRESAYEKELFRFSKIILRIVVGTIIIVFLLNLIITKFKLFNVERVSNLDFLIFCIALVVSIIPEALPVVATFSLSQGSLKLAEKKVVVKRLSAVEDLGGIEVLCTDKTGTLTENKLSLEEIVSSDRKKCLLYALLSSSYIKEEIESALNPFDVSIFEKAPQEIRNSLKNFKGICEIPFDPFRIRNSALLKGQNGEMTLIVKGAPEVILRLSSGFVGNQTREKIEAEIKEAGISGKRILAVAFRKFTKTRFFEEDEKDLTFLGYLSFSDPLKKTAKEAIELSRKLGIQIKILTGDSFEVAGAVAKEVGLVKDAQKEVILGENLESLSEEEFLATCQQFHVFARVSPQIKYKIIQALQKKYEVGFLGEGINDAPALRIANVAIAVESAADISREASDVILLKRDLRVIINGIQEGRNIFYNIQKYIKCTLASNFGNFYSIAAISLAIPFLPMLPIQILLVNLLSDFPLIAVATDRVDAEELKKPKLYQLNQVILLIFLLGFVSTIFDFIFFGIFHKTNPSLLQTLWFIESILTEILLIFSIRTRHFFLNTKRPSYYLMFFSILTFIVTIFLPFTNVGKELFHFTSPPISGILIVLMLLVSYFIVSELVKLVYFWRWKPKIKPTFKI